MSQVFSPARSRHLDLVGVALLAALLLYLVGIDQGQVLALVQGDIAFDQNFIHELVHDGRHAAGFPCH